MDKNKNSIPKYSSLARKRKGFGNINNRRKAYIDIFNISQEDIEKYISVDMKNINHLTCLIQIDLDVTRLPQPAQNDEIMQLKVRTILIKFFIVNDQYLYYQGIHHIALTLAQVCEDNECCVILEKLALKIPIIKIALTEDLIHINVFCFCVFEIIRQMDFELYYTFASKNFLSIYILPYLLTLINYQHVPLKHSLRIFDVICTHDPDIILYLCAAILLKSRDIILSEGFEIDTVRQKNLDPFLHTLENNIEETINHAFKLSIVLKNNFCLKYYLDGMTDLKGLYWVKCMLSNSFPIVTYCNESNNYLPIQFGILQSRYIPNKVQVVSAVSILAFAFIIYKYQNVR